MQHIADIQASLIYYRAVVADWTALGSNDSLQLKEKAAGRGLFGDL